MKAITIYEKHMLLLFIFLFLNFAGCRSGYQGPTAACESNLKNLATALEMYACDYGGDYPRDLSYIDGIYIKKIPLCPITGYEYNYSASLAPDNYTIYCRAWAHRYTCGDTNIYYTPGTGVTHFPDPAPTQEEDKLVKELMPKIRMKEFINRYMEIIVMFLILAGGITIVMIFLNLTGENKKMARHQ